MAYNKPLSPQRLSGGRRWHCNLKARKSWNFSEGQASAAILTWQEKIGPPTKPTNGNGVSEETPQGLDNPRNLNDPKIKLSLRRLQFLVILHVILHSNPTEPHSQALIDSIDNQHRYQKAPMELRLELPEPVHRRRYWVQETSLRVLVSLMLEGLLSSLFLYIHLISPSVSLRLFDESRGKKKGSTPDHEAHLPPPPGASDPKFFWSPILRRN